jgi:hypothetical protein
MLLRNYGFFELERTKGGPHEFFRAVLERTGLAWPL